MIYPSRASRCTQLQPYDRLRLPSVLFVFLSCVYLYVFFKVLLKLPASYKMLGEQRRLFRIARKWLFSLAVDRSIVLAFAIQFIWATRFIITYWQGYFSSWIFPFQRCFMGAYDESYTVFNLQCCNLYASSGPLRVGWWHHSFYSYHPPSSKEEAGNDHSLFPAVVTVPNAELALLVLEQISFQCNTSSKSTFLHSNLENTILKKEEERNKSNWPQRQ